MPKVAPPAATHKFQGRRDWPPESGLDDWGLNATQQETYVELFRRILAAKNAWNEDQHDYYILRRFLRARSYDLEKATTMWLNYLNWKKEFQVDTILQDFYFGERDRFLDFYPQGYHKLDKMGRPIYIQQIGKINVTEIKKVTSEDRMLKFHIQEYERCVKVILPICSFMAGRNIDQTFGIMDVKGVGLGHLTGEVKRLMTLVTKYDQDNYPEMLGHICIINAPAIFRVLWSFASSLIDARTQSKIEILGSNYIDAVRKWVDNENIPDWLGGASSGSLLDDVGPWSDPELVKSLGLNIDELRLGKRPPPQLLPAAARIPSTMRPAPSMTRSSLGPDGRANSDHSLTDGYHSPMNSMDLGSRRFSEYAEPGSQRPGSTSANGIPGGSLIHLQNGGTRGGTWGHVDTIPESGPSRSPRPRMLIDRISALEQVCGPHMERLKNQAAAMTAAGAAGNGVSQSTKSAPEGTLLHRVEVLEEAMETLLAAQEAQLLYQRRLIQEQEQSKAQPSSSGCCCVVM
mmetsp:Transcript_38738/g.86147  ORF Transcript_38738/g.86147 Transcript_38738/m.86147 type:complete len:516 (+) Transcript_38738:123-1670(+)|eukprot:CAMPEP_0202890568 /NCGR_PEP_ID=MMETSP1392-20130828/926_1 /ASSEMBLY_ACC=CAM_ASM_000868 /TAXON_ID=225041 /ORGANISM="Chlamydomonas chlamydogama, Strain SAG 11-48b" /LENGTH=515 /DNA_ID=CAMNT_0049574163 /DNA_START=74 /DNA_END=1621 /DNA_ORIENTATION=-